MAFPETDFFVERFVNPPAPKKNSARPTDATSGQRNGNINGNIIRRRWRDKLATDKPDSFNCIIDIAVGMRGSDDDRFRNARHYTLVLAGGEKLGLQHGGHHVFEERNTLTS